MTLQDSSTRDGECVLGTERHAGREQVIGTPTDPGMMEHRPAYQRRRLGGRTLDVATVAQVTGYPRHSEIKWQVLLQEADENYGQGEVRVDTEVEWASHCEQVFEDTQPRTDLTSDRVANEGAPPQAHGYELWHQSHLSEFHPAGAGHADQIGDKHSQGRAARCGRYRLWRREDTRRTTTT